MLAADSGPPLTQELVVHEGFLRLSMLANDQLAMCKAQQLANIIWAFATIGYIPDTAFLEALAVESVRKRDGFNPQNLANTLWAFAKLEYKPECALLPALAEEIMGKLGRVRVTECVQHALGIR